MQTLFSEHDYVESGRHPTHGIGRVHEALIRVVRSGAGMTQGRGDGLVRLRSDHLEAWISPGHGAAIARLFEPATGFQVLRPTSDENIRQGNTMQFGSFPMVPYSNRIGFRQLAVDGRVVELDCNRPGAPHSFHGNAWMAAWHIEQQQADFLSVVYTHTVGDGHWPFPYQVTQSFTLDGNRFRMRLCVQNLGERAAPAGAGWHPFFTIEPGSQVRFDAAQVWLNDADMLPRESVPATGTWSFRNGQPTQDLAIDNCFHGWDGVAVLTHPGQRRIVTVTGSEKLSSLVVFRPTDGRQFIAIEPVTHVNNGMNLLAQGRRDTGVAILAPHACLDVVSEITVSAA